MVYETTSKAEPRRLRSKSMVRSRPVSPALATLIAQIAEVAVDAYLLDPGDDADNDESSDLRSI